MSAKRLVVLDASALLAWVLNERGTKTVDRMLAVGVAPASVVVETRYRAVEKGHRLPPAQLREALLEMGLVIEPVTDDDVVRAADLIAASRQAPGAGRWVAVPRGRTVHHRRGAPGVARPWRPPARGGPRSRSRVRALPLSCAVV